jgi:hypothetical protein
VPTDGGQIVCAYCGALDRLPADDLARFLEEQPESVVYGPRPPVAKK